MSTAGPVRVVLADDVADIRDLMRMLLERSGFQVVGEAADGDEAVATARRTQPDLIVLDLAMPTTDGLQALPRIRDEAPDAKIVVLSGFQADQMSDEARRNGAHAYVEKGTSAQDILAVLRDVVGGGQPRPPAPLPPPEEEVISALVHELSTPITAIEGFAELLDFPRAEVDDETYTRAVGAIRRNAAHLRGLLSSFADARRIGVNALDLRREPTDVGELVEETADGLRAAIAPHPLDVRVLSSAVVEIDPVRVRQAVINLVQNAAKFSEPKEPVEVVVMTEDDRVLVRVTDRGSGIPIPDRERVFGKFARLRRDAPGTGLGLYISRGIARAHGGDIVVEASSPAGSRFALSLPIGSES